jgi:RNA polymerase sigma-32 factor
MSNVALPVIADGGLAKYLAEIRKVPLLEADEEYMLAKRWREHEDLEAAHRLVTSHLRLVAKLAMGYRHYGLPMADLVSEGNVGLMRAVKKFDPEVGVRLATYAMWWIKASLHEYLLNSWSMVKIGTMAAQRKLFFNLRRLKAKLGILESGDMSLAQAREIAQELKVSEGDVVSMNRRLSARDASLNTPVAANSDVEIQDLLADDSDNQEVRLAARQEARLRSQALAAGLALLSDRERDIIAERHLSEAPATLEDLGKRYGVSRERVRQIEARALSKLRTAMTAA